MKNGTGKSPGGISDQILHTVRGGFYDAIAEVLRAARSNAYRAVNFVMVEAYWNIGRMIVEEEQQGRDRAEYGSYLLRHLSARLTREFGKGLNYTNLKYIRQFYLTYLGHEWMIGMGLFIRRPVTLQ
jgi:hypothetical protein